VISRIHHITPDGMLELTLSELDALLRDVAEVEGTRGDPDA